MNAAIIGTPDADPFYGAPEGQPLCARQIVQ